MTQDFAVLDFIIVGAQPDSVAFALEACWTDVSQTENRLSSAPPPDQPTGLWGRLMARGASSNGAQTVPPLLLQTADTIPPPPHARTDMTAPALGTSGVRLSQPNGENSALTLIECYENLSEEARLAKALSEELTNTEIFFFRYSGSLHPGAHFAFHVYRKGRTLRRAESYCPMGTQSGADWRKTDTGMPHAFEADSLPEAEALPEDIMTPERQGSILQAMGIDPDSLFDAGAQDDNTIALSNAPGGAPISELRNKQGTSLRRTVDFADANIAAEVEDEDASIEEVPKDVPPKLAIPKAPALGPPDDIPIFKVDTSAPIPSNPAEWEQEITAILLVAVETCLPADEQVAWLNSFTKRLESGNTDDALTDAEALILSAERPHAEKAAAAARIRALYAHLDP